MTVLFLILGREEGGSEPSTRNSFTISPYTHVFVRHLKDFNDSETFVLSTDSITTLN